MGVPVGTFETSEGTTGRDRVLQGLINDIRAHGLPADPSLRRFAERLGTSHRMLAYYFGSLDGLLSTVLTTMRAQERVTLAQLASARSLRHGVEAMWAYYTDPARIPEHYAFFSVFARALREREAYAEFLTSLDEWIALTTGLATAEGLEPERAATVAQLLVSGVRGLLLDRLVSDTPGAVDAAFALLLDAVLSQ